MEVTYDQGQTSRMVSYAAFSGWLESSFLFHRSTFVYEGAVLSVGPKKIGTVVILSRCLYDSREFSTYFFLLRLV